MKDYQANSDKSKGKPIEAAGSEAKPEKNIQKVTTGEVKIAQKSVGRKVKDAFIGADMKSVATYTLTDKIIPALKAMVLDAGAAALERALYGENAVRKRVLGQSMGTRVLYNTPPSRDKSPTRAGLQIGVPRPGVTSARAGGNSDFILSSKEEAQLILDNMRGVIDAYDEVSVADLKELVGFEVVPHTDNNYGWRSLSGARVVPTRDGYLLDLPPAQPI